uniref:Uncharacterized protein n=1 Tax=Rhizophora mucronata TaxID=61149 RepID=A0A2P2MWW9_RHIMU
MNLIVSQRGGLHPIGNCQCVTTIMAAIKWHDVTDTNPEEAVPCFALSKNDSCVMSASGGKISLFNMMTFEVFIRIRGSNLMLSRTFAGPNPFALLQHGGNDNFTPAPPAATFLAFHPQDNNIIAIGMDDSSIQIYNVRVDEVKSKLKGHSKRITGLAFSHVLNVLISSGADAQICVWNSDGWEKQKTRFLQVLSGRQSAAQRHMSNFIRTRYTSWLYAKLSLPFMKPQNLNV